MTDVSTYYVYALYQEDGETPFYVGVGQGDRWLSHERTARGKARYENKEKVAVIREMQSRGLVVPKRKLSEGLSKAEALERERATIGKLGLRPHGLLTNKNYGGRGPGLYSKEARLEMSEAYHRVPKFSPLGHWGGTSDPYHDYLAERKASVAAQG